MVIARTPRKKKKTSSNSNYLFKGFYSRRKSVFPLFVSSHFLAAFMYHINRGMIVTYVIVS